MPRSPQEEETKSSYRVDLDIVYVVHKTWQDMFQPTTGFNDSAGVAAEMLSHTKHAAHVLSLDHD